MSSPLPTHTLLLTTLAGSFPTLSPHATLLPTPQKLLGTLETGLALMAISLTGTDTTINMRMPALGRELYKLADRGLGQQLDYKGVRFMFVELAEGEMGVGMGLEDLV